MVVKYNLDNRNVVAGCRRNLVHVHTETAVSGNIDNRLILTAHLRTNRCTQTVAHGAQTAGGQKLSRTFVFIILCRPHLMLSDIGTDDRIAAGYLVDLFHDIRTGQNFLVVAERVHIFQTLNVAQPLVMVHRIQTRV